MPPKHKYQTPSKAAKLIEKSHHIKTDDSSTEKEDDSTEKYSKGTKTVHDLEGEEKNSCVKLEFVSAKELH